MRLGDVVTVNPESIRSGYSFDEIEYIDISSVGTGELQGTQRLQIGNAPSRAKRIVRNGDTLLATVRPNLRSFWFARNPKENTIASTGFAVLRAGKDINERFLYFTVTNQPFTDYLTANAKGAAYPAIDTDTIERAEIFLPPLLTQHKIAAILSAYDDLIENNMRRIKILEEMAQNLYHEWFVKFRFPGHQQARFVDSSLGPIQEGWEAVKLGDLIEIRKGKNITKNTVVQGSVPVVAGGMSPAYYHNAANTRQPVITISASGANAGFICLYYENVWASDCSVIDLYTTPYVYFFYLQLKYRHTEVTRLQRGSAQPHVYPKDLMDLDVVKVPSILLDRFSEEVTPFIQMIRNLTMKNTTLRRTRDLLLPRLISGEVDVSELDITIPEEAAA